MEKLTAEFKAEEAWEKGKRKMEVRNINDFCCCEEMHEQKQLTE